MPKSLVSPDGHPDADAINLALERLPARLHGEYRGKLARRDPGTLHELAFVGRLLQKAKQAPRIEPWPLSRRVDGDVIGLSRPTELEIKASIATKFETDVETMCADTRRVIEAEFPGFRGHVRLRNLFCERVTPDGKTELDAEETKLHIVEGVRRAIVDGGAVDPAYRRFDPNRLVARIDEDGQARVSLSYATLPGTLDIDVFARTLTRALDEKHQFSGDRAGVLVLINARDPRANQLHVLLDDYFSKYPHLAAVAAVPCPSINGVPVIYTPDRELAGANPLALTADDAQRLAEFFRVRIGMGVFLTEVEAELAEKQRDESERPLDVAAAAGADNREESPGAGEG